MENEKQTYIIVSLVAICFTFLYKIVFSLIKFISYDTKRKSN
jgi:hypothetical protein